MRRVTMILATLTLCLLVGCVGRGGAKTPKAKENAALSVSGPSETIIVTQGDSNRFSVSVSRENFSDAVKVSFELPDGLVIKEKSGSITGDSSEFQIEALADAPLHDGEKVTITGKYKDLSEKGTFRVTVLESAENAKKRKVKTHASLVESLDKIKTKLDSVDAELKTASAQVKAQMLGKLGTLYKQITDRGDQIGKLEDINADNWQNLADQLQTAMNVLNGRIDEFSTELQSAISKSKEK